MKISIGPVAEPALSPPPPPPAALVPRAFRAAGTLRLGTGTGSPTSTTASFTIPAGSLEEPLAVAAVVRVRLAPLRVRAAGFFAFPRPAALPAAAGALLRSSGDSKSRSRPRCLRFQASGWGHSSGDCCWSLSIGPSVGLDSQQQRCSVMISAIYSEGNKLMPSVGDGWGSTMEDGISTNVFETEMKRPVADRV